MTALLPVISPALSEETRTIEERVVSAAMSGLAAHSCRVYTRHLSGFIEFLGTNRLLLSRESVQTYCSTILELSNYNQALSACKRLASEAAAHGWISYNTAMQIGTIRSRKQLGGKAGTWLSLAQATALLASPSARNLPGKRDRAILALLLGTGLRRDELARLTVEQIQTRDGRTMLIDVVGKGSRIRSVAVPAWVVPIVSAWLDAAQITSGPVVRSIRHTGGVNGSLSTTAIWDIVTKHSASIGVECSPHDMRRTYAKLARSNGAPLDVIQKSLGHSSVATTERYTNSGEQANAGDWFTI